MRYIRYNLFCSTGIKQRLHISETNKIARDRLEWRASGLLNQAQEARGYITP